MQTPRRHLLATLRARFDGAALRVALPGQDGQAVRIPTAAQAARWAPLQAWCFEGVGDGRSPLLQPTRLALMDQRFSVALWPTAAGRTEHDLIDAFCRHLDGSHQLLAAGGALGGLLLRLRVKARDVAWWRGRRPTDPWDCGYALNEPAARAALARFEPRRATLVVAMDWTGQALVDAINAMARSSTRFAHPVRWLVVHHAPGDITEQLRSAGLPVRLLQPEDADR
ncbi:hypothetical protein [Hydrogenophaga sp. PBL-H3]|uniref:hypothetical protein n=1 Tax=Hydrogenophaga sp. PBL-H3 TaxID=434010 RepID=UPI00131F4B30|nr:hypothetical protein [Hydrogenophaga sp. PBL-H3]QHE74748.1 hypothetical protein F9Z45_01155 [Hydrogenophaga sp. PBL-H3]